MLGAVPSVGADAGRQEPARKNQVDGNTVGCQVWRERLYQAGDAGPQAIRQVNAVHWLLDRARLDPDYASPMASTHVRPDRTDEPHEVQRDNFECLPPVVVGEVAKLAPRRTAGVGDEHVDSAEVGDGCRYHAVDP